MSLISVRARRPKHRAVDKVQELRDENQRLLAQLVGARDYIDLLDRDLAEERSYRAEAEQVAACTAADLDERTEQLDEARAELATTRALLAPYLAAEATAGAVTVPEMERDTAAMEDQATEPINVLPLWDALGVSPVHRIADTPGNDPRTPSWVPTQDNETTQSLRVITA
ncbi:hypothetical protein PV405_29975 [Streptomyces sp. ME02-6979-3A]|uniref:hypothetical protein n=1 Tax=Streptomyces sp. ME02-6979-3A TaxID=3028673 RepID=UPI0029B4399D|nr:hypothetical protein [Streptomyces sp. ME02-6979-3A]MDX3328841.1 hypothetical protein [Streptomyces sp. ME02-6979-3A]